MTAPPSAAPGAVAGAPRVWLRLEGLAVLALATWLFARGGHSWPIFAVLFLAPDVAFAAYLAGPRIGAMAYNALHSYLGPIALGALFVATGRPPVIALVWAAHVGFDRLLGYGLKYPHAFHATHLGAIGPARRAAARHPT